MPVVVMLPPLMAVVPPVSVVRLAADKVPPIVVVALLFKMTVPKAVLVPTLPVKVIMPVPESKVRSWAVVLVMVELKVIPTAVKCVVLVKTTGFAKLIAPVVWMVPPDKVMAVLPVVVRLANEFALPMVPDRIMAPVLVVSVSARC